MEILAYFEDWSRRPGDLVKLAVSTVRSEVHVTFERILSGPGAPGESKVETEDRSDVLDVRIPGRRQETSVGSYGACSLSSLVPNDAAALSIHCWIWPSTPKYQSKQTIWKLDNNISLSIEDAHLVLRHGDQPLCSTQIVLSAKTWYSTAVVFDCGKVTLDVRDMHGRTASRHDRSSGTAMPFSLPSNLLLAASSVRRGKFPENCYNGKIDDPRLYYRALSDVELGLIRSGDTIVADLSWNCSRDFGSDQMTCKDGAGSGRLFNGAERGVTGHLWDGRSDSFIETPDHYTAIQFHDDDMVDSNWDYDLEFILPDTLKSGIYCVRLEAEGCIERVPLFVLGKVEEDSDTLLLMPTNTYLAYANERLATLDFSVVMAHPQQPHADDVYLSQHVELGRSLYDTHRDGTPCRSSSRRRPIIQMRPGFPNWLTGSYRHFPMDLYFVEWMEKLGRDYHIATDEDLEREGCRLLSKYKVVVAGSHPEYWTRQGRDILDRYLNNGGQLMYLGGNGFYWVTSRDPNRPWVVEVRRDNSGTRCWDAPAGERGHVYTSEQGGIWKNRGLGPHRLVGIGFSAEGWSQGCGYARSDASYSGVGSKVFKGINQEIVGDFGFVLGGAVGDEIDRFDPALGSPIHATVLASSTGVGREYIHVVEEQNVALPDQGGDLQPNLVRSDIVYFEIEGGGAVFSVGSIALVGSMAWNGFDNNMALVVTNALDMLIERKAQDLR